MPADREPVSVGSYNYGIDIAAGVAKDWLDPQYVRLHAGEMSPQDMRNVTAVVRAIVTEIEAEKL